MREEEPNRRLKGRQGAVLIGTPRHIPPLSSFS